MVEPPSSPMSETGHRSSYAVVFADITGSTRLYETIGDNAAKALVLEIENEIADMVRGRGGVVQEIVGDEVMFRFADSNPAVSCACDIQRAVETLSGGRDLRIAVRIGLHFGPAILENGRMFGDTVNTAARMAGIAQGGQIITTGEVVRNLTDIPDTMVRRFDEVKVKGKREELVVYEVLWHQTNVTYVSAVSRPQTEAPSSLLLEHNERPFRLQPWQGLFAIGRGNANDLIVNSGSVSRQHATIEFARGRFVLTDTSTNGTYVQTEDGPCIFFRREATPLVGRGQIGLGAPPSEGANYVIRFNSD